VSDRCVLSTTAVKRVYLQPDELRLSLQQSVGLECLPRADLVVAPPSFRAGLLLRFALVLVRPLDALLDRLQSRRQLHRRRSRVLDEVEDGQRAWVSRITRLRRPRSAILLRLMMITSVFLLSLRSQIIIRLRRYNLFLIICESR